MSIKYDPMTGEPIEVKDEEQNAETSEMKDTDNSQATEDNVNEETVVEEKEGIDNTSGSENESEIVEEEKVSEHVESPELSELEKESDLEPSDVVEETKFTDSSPVTGPVEETPAKGINVKLYLGIVAALLVLLVLVVIFIASGGFMTNKSRVFKATAATIDFDTHLGKDIAPVFDIIKSNKYTINYSVDDSKYGTAEGAMIVAGKEKQIVLDVNVEDLPKFSMKAGIDSKRVSAEIPELCDRLFVYNYVEDKDGVLAEEYSDIVEQVDAYLQEVYNAAPADAEVNANVVKVIKKHIDELVFDKAEPKEFKVDDKKVSCKGYEVEIDSEFYIELLDDLEEIYEDEYEDQLSSVKKLTGQSWSSSFKDLRKQAREIPDMVITFYIYKGKLAAVNADAGKKNGELEILFRGGDYRAQNVIVKFDDDTVFSLKGTDKKDKETFTIEVEDEEVCEITYNYKKGKLSLDMDGVEVDAVITSKSGEIVFDIKDIELSYNESADAKITFSKGAKILDYECDDVFDIGNADQDDFADVMKSIDTNRLLGLGGLF